MLNYLTQDYFTFKERYDSDLKKLGFHLVIPCFKKLFTNVIFINYSKNQNDTKNKDHNLQHVAYLHLRDQKYNGYHIQDTSYYDFDKDKKKS